MLHRHDGISESSNLVYFRLLHELRDAGPSSPAWAQTAPSCAKRSKRLDGGGLEVLRDGGEPASGAGYVTSTRASGWEEDAAEEEGTGTARAP